MASCLARSDDLQDAEPAPGRDAELRRCPDASIREYFAVLNQGPDKTVVTLI